MAWQDTYAALIGEWSLEYVPAKVIAQMSTSHQLAIFMRIDTTPGLHLWMGVGDVPAGFDSLDEAGTVYIGAGRLLNIPSLEVLMNGQAGSVTFGLSGIDPDTAAQVSAALPPVRGKEVHIGLTTLDDYYQPMSAIIPVWRGVASHTVEESQMVPQGEDASTTLALAVVTGATTRSRPSFLMWSPAHQTALWRELFPTPAQQAANPRDRFCDQTPRLGRGVAPVWP